MCTYLPRPLKLQKEDESGRTFFNDGKEVRYARNLLSFQGFIFEAIDMVAPGKEHGSYDFVGLCP